MAVTSGRLTKMMLVMLRRRDRDECFIEFILTKCHSGHYGYDCLVVACRAGFATFSSARTMGCAMCGIVCRFGVGSFISRGALDYMVPQLSLFLLFVLE